MRNLCFPLILATLFFFLTPAVNAQINYNANTKTTKYTDHFLYGSNMAYKNGNWSDEDIADMLVGSNKKDWEGVGVNSLRPALYHNFVEKYGYDIRVKTFEYYSEIGTKNNVVFIGDRPSEQYREKKEYASGVASKSYENLYESIWDKGENGTPVNENNYYALYVYKLVQKYGTNVKFWEIKNEPDYTAAITAANNEPGTNPNWWDKDPAPADLHNLKAPIQSYIRMLRISYEVIKYVDPDAFVCIGGIGYASFLDAVLRNTDNPDGGKVTADYPLKGGAWFDCLSYHIYPMYNMRVWTGHVPGSVGGFRYFRHTDAATEIVMSHKDKMVDVLKKYGYDGAKYPSKEMIVTEFNIPNKQVREYLGSEEAQRNFLIKTAVVAQRHKISGLYPYCPWDAKEHSEEGKEYDYKGFYKPIPDSPGSGALRMNESGVAWRTTSKQLNGRRYDEAETNKMKLPTGIDGGAFYSSISKDYTYVLWAKTSIDMSEEASGTYSFAADKNAKKLVSTAWNEKETIITGNTIALTSAPVFVKINGELTEAIPVTGVSLNEKAKTIGLKKTFQLEATVSPANAKNKNVTWSSSNPAIAHVDNLGLVTGLLSGKAKITVKTVDGNKTASCDFTITSDTIPVSYIMLNSSYQNIIIGDTWQLVATFNPTNATNQKMLWTSADSNIASVNSEGLITGHSEGTVIITANPVEGNGSKAKKCSIIVKNGTGTVSVTEVALNHSSKELVINDTFNLMPTVIPTNATNKTVRWSSSNKDIATVDSNGNVKAIAEGTAIITVTTNNGAKTATCNITVGDAISKSTEEDIQQLIVAPNPSKGEFKIMFELPNQETVLIELYSTTGMLIKKLVANEVMEKGKHELPFSLSLQQGVYIVRLKSDSMSEKRNIIINH